MTINERVSAERLNTIKSWRETYGQDANVMIPASEAESIISELQQYRAAAEKPIGSFHIIDQQVDGTTDYVKDGEWPIDNGELLVYAAPQVTSVLEIAARLVDTYLLNEGTDSEFIACYTISKSDSISEKGKQIWADWRALSAALKSSQTAPAVQAEQLSGNAEQVSQPYTLREGLAAIRNLGPIDAEKIQAERDALNEPDVPDGYALVPIEPTKEMMLHKSGCQRHAWDDADCPMRQTRRLVWGRMIEAVPKQEAQEVKK